MTTPAYAMMFSLLRRKTGATNKMQINTAGAQVSIAAWTSLGSDASIARVCAASQTIEPLIITAHFTGSSA
jgi:hypothetical protein